MGLGRPHHYFFGDSMDEELRKKQRAALRSAMPMTRAKSRMVDDAQLDIMIEAINNPGVTQPETRYFKEIEFDHDNKYRQLFLHINEDPKEYHVLVEEMSSDGG